MTTKQIVEKLIANQEVGYVPLSQLYKVAEHLGADISLAKRLRGIGFQTDTLIDAIEKRITEINQEKTQ